MSKVTTVTETASSKKPDVSAKSFKFSVDNFYNVCRICFASDVDNLLDLHLSHIQNKSLYDVIINCVSTTITNHDGLPSSICLSCAHTVVIINAFKNQYIHAETLLTSVCNQLYINANPVLERKHVEIFYKSVPEFSELIKDCEFKKIGNAESVDDCLKFFNFQGEESDEAEGMTFSDDFMTLNDSSNAPDEKIDSQHEDVKSIKQTKASKAVTGNVDKFISKGYKLIDNSYECVHCQARFGSLLVLSQHRLKAHPKLVHCGNCDMREFIDSHAMDGHKIAVHDMVQCEFCTSIVSAANIESHIQRNHRVSSPSVNGKSEGLSSAVSLSSLLDAPIPNDIGGSSPPTFPASENSGGRSTSSTPVGGLSPTTMLMPPPPPPFAKAEVHAKHDSLLDELDAFFSSQPAQLEEPSRLIECTLCGEKFSDYQSFITHRTQRHPDSFSCNICTSGDLFTERGFREHRVREHGHVLCTICNYTYREEVVTHHLRDFHTKTPGQMAEYVHCADCRMILEFPGLPELVKHMESHGAAPSSKNAITTSTDSAESSSGAPAAIKCPICLAVLANFADFAVHVAARYKQYHICTVCKSGELYTFTQYSHHMDQKHDRAVCPHCQIVLIKPHLRSHVLKRHTVKENQPPSGAVSKVQPVVEKERPKSVPVDSFVGSPLKVVAQKSVMCNHCKLTYPASVLPHHLKSCHRSATPSPVPSSPNTSKNKAAAEPTKKGGVCKICSKAFGTYESYKQHLKDKHRNSAARQTAQGSEPSPSQKAQKSKAAGNAHACHLCDRVFDILASLHQHMVNRHSLTTSVKGVVRCDICGVIGDECKFVKHLLITHAKK